MKELIRFRQFLTEGYINENVSPAALIKVYQDEIRAVMANEQENEVPAYEKGIEMLKQGASPEEANDEVYRMLIKITGDYSSDPTVFMDLARKIDAQGQLNENIDPQDQKTLEVAVDNFLNQGDEVSNPKAGDELIYDWEDDDMKIKGEIPSEFVKFDENFAAKFEVRKVGGNKYEFKVTAKVDVDKL